MGCISACVSVGCISACVFRLMVLHEIISGVVAVAEIIPNLARISNSSVPYVYAGVGHPVEGKYGSSRWSLQVCKV